MNFTQNNLLINLAQIIDLPDKDKSAEIDPTSFSKN